MFSRASRIFNTSQSSSDPGPASATLSETARLSRWRKIIIKVQLVFQFLSIQEKTRKLLGEAVFDSFLGHNNRAAPTADPSQTYRMLNGEVVGRPLKPSDTDKAKATAKMDPAMCKHPANMMKARSNRRPNGTGVDWWVCLMCTSRWERLKQSDLQGTGMIPSYCPEDLVTFGKHSGETMQEVWEKDGVLRVGNENCRGGPKQQSRTENLGPLHTPDVARGDLHGRRVRNAGRGHPLSQIIRGSGLGNIAIGLILGYIALVMNIAIITDPIELVPTERDSSISVLVYPTESGYSRKRVDESNLVTTNTQSESVSTNNHGTWRPPRLRSMEELVFGTQLSTHCTADLDNGLPITLGNFAQSPTTIVPVYKVPIGAVAQSKAETLSPRNLVESGGTPSRKAREEPWGALVSRRGARGGIYYIVYYKGI